MSVFERTIHAGGFVERPGCKVCQLLKWHKSLFFWLHELVILHGAEAPTANNKFNDQLSEWNKAHPDQQQTLCHRVEFHTHFHEHLPIAWMDMSRVKKALPKNMMPTGSGMMAPDVVDGIRSIADKNAAVVVDDLGRIGTILERVELRFKQFDNDVIGKEMKAEHVAPFKQLADVAIKGLDAFIRLRAQDKLLTAALVQFTDRFTVETMTDMVAEVDILVVELRRMDQHKAADLVAVRVRDILVKCLTANTKRGIEDLRTHLKLG
jgi:hypothetical protein